MRIANELLDSVEEPVDEEWSRAWLAELDRRAREVESGEAELEDWEDVKARVSRELQGK